MYSAAGFTPRSAATWQMGFLRDAPFVVIPLGPINFQAFAIAPVRAEALRRPRDEPEAAVFAVTLLFAGSVPSPHVAPSTHLLHEIVGVFLTIDAAALCAEAQTNGAATEERLDF
jgi:hypothetical protein